MDEGWRDLRLTATGLAARRGERLIFADLSLAVVSGELLALVGANGVGKTTLLRLLAGFLRPERGTVDLAPAEAAGAIHYLGHQDGLKPALTLGENLGFWRRMLDRADLSVDAALAELGLATLADIPAGYLSAGQKRRAALARLIINRRPVWLLDEPTAALDAAAAATLGRLITAHQAAGGIVLAATHTPLPVAPDQTLTLTVAA